MTEVYLNGKFIGSVDNPDEFVDHIYSERRKNAITNNMNIHYDKKNNEIILEASKGRLRRPLIVVKNGKYVT